MKTITLCYVHVPGCKNHAVQAKQFIESYKAFPPGVEHKTLVICQGREPDSEFRECLSALPNYREYIHDDSGWDIGGYIAAASVVDTDCMLCCGGSTTVRRAGWMTRMEEAWHNHGPGFYGTLSSFQCRPHFNTNGFFCEPAMLRAYPNKVITTADRYEFEHGKGALWLCINRCGLPTKLVTWDGEYDWKEWRKPANISCRGDQSNCLMFFRINYQFEEYARNNPQAHNNLMYLTDAHVTDPEWRAQLKGLTPLGEVVEG